MASTQSSEDDRRFRVGLSVDISSVNGAYGHLHLNEYSEPVELNTVQMAALLVRANELMSQLVREFFIDS